MVDSPPETIPSSCSWVTLRPTLSGRLLLLGVGGHASNRACSSLSRASLLGGPPRGPPSCGRTPPPGPPSALGAPRPSPVNDSQPCGPCQPRPPVLAEVYMGACVIDWCRIHWLAPVGLALRLSGPHNAQEQCSLARASTKTAIESGNVSKRASEQAAGEAVLGPRLMRLARMSFIGGRAEEASRKECGLSFEPSIGKWPTQHMSDCLGTWCQPAKSWMFRWLEYYVSAESYRYTVLRTPYRLSRVISRASLEKVQSKVDPIE